MPASKSRPFLRSTQCLGSSPARALYRCLTTATSSRAPKPQPQPPSSSPRKPPIPSSPLSYHWDTLPPTPGQLQHASQFFTRRPSAFLWSAPKFKTMDFDSSPEVCFLGRSNVGKSSLLNALLNKKIAHASSTPGRTRSMNAFAVGGEDDVGRRLVVMDMPGYGKGGREEWGVQIMKYIEKRRELKRVFLLIDTLHGVKESDRQVVQMLRGLAVPYQVVLAKADRVLFDKSRVPSEGALEGRLEELGRRMEEVRELVSLETEEDGGSVGEVIACSAERRVKGKLLGIDALRFAMLHAAGLELRPKVGLAAPVEVVPFEEIFGKDGG